MICLQCGSKMNEYPKGWGCPGCDNFHIQTQRDTLIDYLNYDGPVFSKSKYYKEFPER